MAWLIKSWLIKFYFIKLIKYTKIRKVIYTHSSETHAQWVKYKEMNRNENYQSKDGIYPWRWGRRMPKEKGLPQIQLYWWCFLNLGNRTWIIAVLFLLFHIKWNIS